MEIELMKAHVKSNTHMDNINPVLKEDNSNVRAFYRADVIGKKRFAQNYGGYPRSDIAQIMAVEDLKQQEALLNQLTDFSNPNNPTAGLTDAEIMLAHRSKYCQTAAEQTDWIETQLATRQAMREAEILKAQQASEKKIDFSETPNPNVNE